MTVGVHYLCYPSCKPFSAYQSKNLDLGLWVAMVTEPWSGSFGVFPMVVLLLSGIVLILLLVISIFVLFFRVTWGLKNRGKRSESLNLEYGENNCWNGDSMISYCCCYGPVRPDLVSWSWVEISGNSALVTRIDRYSGVFLPLDSSKHWSLWLW